MVWQPTRGAADGRFTFTVEESGTYEVRYVRPKDEDVPWGVTIMRVEVIPPPRVEPPAEHEVSAQGTAMPEPTVRLVQGTAQATPAPPTVTPTPADISAATATLLPPPTQFVFLHKWGTEGSGDGQFAFANGIAVDGAGNVYVVDTDNYNVQVFNREGRFLRKWGTEGSADGQFELPRYIATDSAGNVYLADTGNHRVQVFAPVQQPPP